MKRAIIIDWIGLPFGILTDVYLFQKNLGCDVVWISCHDENGVYNFKNFKKAIIEILEKYDELFFIETESFAYIEKEQKTKSHCFYFLKNIDIKPIVNDDLYYKKMHLIDYAISRTNITTDYYKKLQEEYNYKYKIIYTKFTSIDYSLYYCKRLYFKTENIYNGS